ncbi:MAG: amino-acid N-acetyltransferase [Pseudomonadales bacterium]|jgi:amino-acid N-acetyltransferase|nr:amino-acid N-acetyltransferase [Pseudomonadales bacterium]MDP6469520.1 amino-acid N-acetyltransferase [Pseudomonadales bacterium]MDP6827361.1 amino-acid N-acetyltransferase [Pseudomonadales bacterium]MDP6971184.1 amino-acid N-acetyltransferase [Pseudomonadales bacterium]
MSETTHSTYARWFRDSTPYISAHRGKIFVVLLGGEALAHENLINIVHDLTLLHVLGVHLVLVHGARPQIDTAIPGARFHTHAGVRRRITEPGVMTDIVGTCAQQRARLEAAFSTGLPSSPLHNTDVKLVSGNLLLARPIGVLDGVDHQLTGQVRRVHTEAIRTYLQNGSIVLLSPIGYSPSGETFNLAAEEVAERVAVALRAEKLIIFDEAPFLTDEEGRRLSSLTPSQLDVDTLPQATTRGHARALLRAVREGVSSGQLVGYTEDGALLAELFTADGVGTQVVEQDMRTIRQATTEDVGDIVELIRPLEEAGTLVKRSRNVLEQEIHHFLVAELDGFVIGCCAIYPAGEHAELACVAVHPSHRAGAIGRRLLVSAEQLAIERGFTQLFVLTTQARDWFVEQGFKAGDIAELPAPRQELYNYQRNSQILIKKITPHSSDTTS